MSPGILTDEASLFEQELTAKLAILEVAKGHQREIKQQQFNELEDMAKKEKDLFNFQDASALKTTYGLVFFNWLDSSPLKKTPEEYVIFIPAFSLDENSWLKPVLKVCSGIPGI